MTEPIELFANSSDAPRPLEEAGMVAIQRDLDGPPWARVLRVVGHREAERLLATLGVERREIPHLTRQVLHRLVQVGPLANPLALRLKSQFTHIGGEAAIPGAAYDHEGESEVILMGQLDQFELLRRRLGVGVPDLRAVGDVLEQALLRDSRQTGAVIARDYQIDVGAGTKIMGVVNVTPDSFSDGGMFLEAPKAIERGLELAAQGAAIIDIGGASSRPGADPVEADVEADRVVPVVSALASEAGVPISVDTTNARVAEAALEAGASIVNDISGLSADPMMAAIAADSGAGVILMHMRGDSRTMQEQTTYADLVGDVWRFLATRVVAARAAGIAGESIVVDPGIGFAKTADQNLTILRRLGEFRSLGVPLLVGTSRKSFIGQVLDLPVDDRLEGTDATVAWCVFQGAWCVRVHDVDAAVRVCRMVDSIVSAP